VEASNIQRRLMYSAYAASAVLLLCSWLIPGAWGTVVLQFVSLGAFAVAISRRPHWLGFLTAALLALGTFNTLLAALMTGPMPALALPLPAGVETWSVVLLAGFPLLGVSVIGLAAGVAVAKDSRGRRARELT